MNILVKKDNQIFGPHSREEILEFIENGELNEYDMASPDGEENWDSLGKLLTLSKVDASDSSMHDQFKDDEVDYEKLKEWEDVFIDEDGEGNEEDENSALDGSDSNVVQDITLPDTEPPPIQSNSQVDVAVPPSIEPELADVDTSYPQDFPTVEPELNQEPEQNYSPPPSLPLPPPPPSKRATENPPTRNVRDRISASHKIKGLNSKQTVIVVKGSGIISKIYSTSLIFIILFILASIVGFAGLIFVPDRVTPIFLKMGIPKELIETFSSPNESPK